MLKLSAKLLHFFELYKFFVKKYNKPRPFFGRSRFNVVRLSYFLWFSQITGTTKMASNTMPTIIVILFIMSKF